jgi:hypothetical protein
MGYAQQAGPAPMPPIQTTQQPIVLPPMSAMQPMSPGMDPNAPPPPPSDPSACPATPAEDKSNYKYSWGGQYRILPNSSNFTFQPLFITNDQHTQTFVNQRMRVWATVEPNEHVEGYIQMQIGGINWGTNVDFPKRFAGFQFPPAPNVDTIGAYIRRGWVAYKDEEWGKVRVGFLDWHDSFGDTLASSDYDFDIGGIDWNVTLPELNNLHFTAGFFLLSDRAFLTTDENVAGKHTALLYTFDADQPIDDHTSIGASVYWIADQGDYSYSTFDPYRSSYDAWFGVRASTKVMERLPVNAFAILNTGDRTNLAGQTIFRHTGYAGKFEMGPVEIGPGKFSTQFLYASGSDHPGIGDTSEFRTVAQTYRDNFGAQGYWSYMHITSPAGSSDVNDLGVSLQDRGLGLITVQGKYEYPICPKLTGTASAGWLHSANNNPANGHSNIGTELAQMFTYNFTGGLKLDTGVAYLFTGDFYKQTAASPKPDNLIEVFARLQLEF